MLIFTCPIDYKLHLKKKESFNKYMNHDGPDIWGKMNSDFSHL